MNTMNGAQALLQTLIKGGVDTCFMNPGTSEMHFVAALDQVPQMRSVLGLFEGVVTGAADGYGRMKETPAATLLHLGPGLGNGIANLHNARRAQTPIVNIVGDHATYHRQHDAPLHTDIESLARPVSGWYRSAESASSISQDTADAITASLCPPGQIATLVLPADTAWTPAGPIVSVPEAPQPSQPDAARIDRLARLLHKEDRVTLLLGNRAMSARCQEAASRIAAATGCRILGGRTVARLQRGAGRPEIERIPYPVDQAIALLSHTQHIVLVGSEPPVAFFAYPGKPSRTAPPDCAYHRLAEDHEDLAATLEALADALDAPTQIPNRAKRDAPDLPTGALTLEAIWAAVAALMPENAIVSDEAITSGRSAMPLTAGAPPHDWLHVTGGAIGQGLPVATGAAVACPERRVLAMQADGSAFYTLQALWTQAREELDVTTVIFANHSYAILQGELANVGAAHPTGSAARMLHMQNPKPDWIALARGMGVPGQRAESADEFVDALRRSLATKGPSLIEAPI